MCFLIAPDSSIMNDFYKWPTCNYIFSYGMSSNILGDSKFSVYLICSFIFSIIWMKKNDFLKTYWLIMYEFIFSHFIPIILLLVIFLVFQKWGWRFICISMWLSFGLWIYHNIISHVFYTFAKLYILLNAGTHTGHI